MVENNSSSTHGEYHHRHYQHGTKQSLSAFEYINCQNVRGTVDHHVPPRIPDGFKSSRAFDTVIPMNRQNSNKASEQSSRHQRSDNMNMNNSTSHAMFIRPTVSTHTNNSHNSSRNTYRQTRNTDVSELFLAEAKAAQAKMDMEMDGNSSLEIGRAHV